MPKYNRVSFAGFDCNVTLHTYQHGGTCVRLVDAEDGMPVATATTWLPGLADAEVAIKDYSENEGVYDALLKSGVIEHAHRYQAAGSMVFPVCILGKGL